jgi:thiamine-monophosphate kinase
VNEHERIAALRALFAAQAREPGAAGVTVELGVGDDAALLGVEGGATRLVVTVDEQVEDTHFRLGWLSLGDLGWRATMAAASDVAAMGGRVAAVVASLVVPRSLADDELLALAEGQRRAAAALGGVAIGGNLARGPALSIGTTVLGTVSGPGLRRDGAREGDDLLLAGPVGRAAAGLALLANLDEEAAAEEGAVGEAAQVCLAAWRRPEARQACGLAALEAGARALIDVSDGLAADAGHVATASGLRLVLEERALRTDATLATLATRLRRAPLGLALGGGEDYALLAAAPEGTAIPGFVRVGRCERGAAAVVVERLDGARDAPPAGFDHFT